MRSVLRAAEFAGWFVALLLASLLYSIFVEPGNDERERRMRWDD